MSFALLSIIAFQNFTWKNADTFAGSKKCSSQKLREILAPANAAEVNVKVDCSFTLSSQDVVTKGLILEGSEASGVSISCRGARLQGNAASENQQRLLIASKKSKLASGVFSWDRPEQISIDSCKVYGSSRIRGLGNNGEAVDVRESSRIDRNHTARAQAAAPRKIFFESMAFIGNGTNSVYIAPGVTEVTIQNSVFSGTANVAIYMDAESGSNRIIENKFDVQTSRELIAIDGSAKNYVYKNEFIPKNESSIYLYRNCGEGGTVRHQTPSENIISANTFYQEGHESIHVGSRKGRSSYCSHDDGFPFGSSKNDWDYADNNKIIGNRFVANAAHKDFISRFVIVNSSTTTEIGKNKISIGSPSALKFAERVAGEFKDLGGNSVAKIDKPTAKFNFECKGTSNSGCFKEVRCPANKKILAAKAGCNLESTSHIDWPKVKALDENQVSVIRESDNVSDGLCQLGDVQIKKDEADIKVKNLAALSYGCKEKDKNGGECIIRGVLTCEI